MKDLRKQKKITQIKIQLMTGIDQSDYSKMEREERNPTFEQCKRLAIVLNTSMDYLAGITDNPAPYERNNSISY